MVVKSTEPAVEFHRSESVRVLFQLKVALVLRAGLLGQPVWLSGLQEVQVCARAWGRSVAASPARAKERAKCMINAAVASERGCGDERSARSQARWRSAVRNVAGAD